MTVINFSCHHNYFIFSTIFSSMESTPSFVYRQLIDKQRVVVVGANRSLIAEMLQHVLQFHRHPVDYVGDQPDHNRITAHAPVAIIQAEHDLLLDYHHHILVISSPYSSATPLLTLCNATPKSGIIVYPETDGSIKTVAAAERADVQVISYKTYQHEKTATGVILISSTNEKFPVKFFSLAHLSAAAAAKEVLKKIGISSGQFYKAIQSLE